MSENISDEDDDDESFEWSGSDGMSRVSVKIDV